MTLQRQHTKTSQGSSLWSRSWGCAFLLAVCLCLFSGPAFSATVPAASAEKKCPKGLPCLVDLTQNDPEKKDDGPNAKDSPNASKSEVPACDADFMNQIYANAFLEAEREVVSASALIAKPDSILEYTCFDQAAATTAKDLAKLFGESDNWKDLDINTGGDPPDTNINVFQGDNALDNTLNAVIFQALNGYVKTNFWHDFLGGMATGDDNSLSAGVGGAKKTCDHMYNVFHVAKCSNFGLEAPYMTFQEMIKTDPRTHPAKCTSKPQITQKMIDLAKNKGFKYAAVDKPNTFIAKMISDGKKCADPLPTGAIVDYVKRDMDFAGNPITKKEYSYPEQVCPTPGCSLDNKGNEDPSDDKCVASAK